MKSPRITWLLCGLLLAVIGVFAFQHLLARPSLAAFDPGGMGELESSMWRSYYEEKYIRLAWQTMQVACGQYGFSWWDGLSLSGHAALSALYFKNNINSPHCIGHLEAYYRLVRQASSVPFDIHEAARLELQWWRERRLKLSSLDYERTVARLAGVLYGIAQERALPAARLRCSAMAYRDERRNGQMHDAEWKEVERQLVTAYATLKMEIEAR